MARKIWVPRCARSCLSLHTQKGLSLSPPHPDATWPGSWSGGKGTLSPSPLLSSPGKTCRPAAGSDMHLFTCEVQDPALGLGAGSRDQDLCLPQEALARETE